MNSKIWFRHLYSLEILERIKGTGVSTITLDMDPTSFHFVPLVETEKILKRCQEIGISVAIEFSSSSDFVIEELIRKLDNNFSDYCLIFNKIEYITLTDTLKKKYYLDNISEIPLINDNLFQGIIINSESSLIDKVDKYNKEIIFECTLDPREIPSKFDAFSLSMKIPDFEQGYRKPDFKNIDKEIDQIKEQIDENNSK